MSNLLVFLVISNLVNLWLIAAISLTKILHERNESGWQILCAWIPLLAFIPVAKIMGMGFWKLFGILFLMTIVLKVVDGILLNILMPGGAIVYLILIVIIYIWPTWFIWSKIAEVGQHDNPDMLGILTGLPIAGVFAIPYIAWAGRW